MVRLAAGDASPENLMPHPSLHRVWDLHSSLGGQTQVYDLSESGRGFVAGSTSTAPVDSRAVSEVVKQLAVSAAYSSSHAAQRKKCAGVAASLAGWSAVRLSRSDTATSVSRSQVREYWWSPCVGLGLTAMSTWQMRGTCYAFVPVRMQDSMSTQTRWCEGALGCGKPEMRCSAAAGRKTPGSEGPPRCHE